MGWMWVLVLVFPSDSSSGSSYLNRNFFVWFMNLVRMGVTEGEFRGKLGDLRVKWESPVSLTGFSRGLPIPKEGGLIIS
jgi:hypothetical protein